MLWLRFGLAILFAAVPLTALTFAPPRLAPDVIAMSPPTLALGMAATIGAASAMTVPNRRRTSNWLQQAVEWLGLS